MATISKLRGKWQAMVRRKGLAPRSKSFDKRTDAEKWARDTMSYRANEIRLLSR